MCFPSEPIAAEHFNDAGDDNECHYDEDEDEEDLKEEHRSVFVERVHRADKNGEQQKESLQRSIHGVLSFY